MTKRNEVQENAKRLLLEIFKNQVCFPGKIVEEIMCTTVELSVTLKAPAETGFNWRDTH